MGVRTWLLSPVQNPFRLVASIRARRAELRSALGILESDGNPSELWTNHCEDATEYVASSK